ncbi:MAG: 1,4-dihydroxy-2-naphthoate octaprenyltransferase [Bacteroidaceae bacterium]|nr:1,4-dihydroxy-2-naphthoate octaprenyltransferase [Bacteroidaceae bacterium]
MRPDTTIIKTNSLRAWLLASRPKTLSGAAVPVAVALSMAWVDCQGLSAVTTEGFKWLPALLCLLFAFLMQVDANLVNDYFDCLRGVDGEDRLGPERACAQGWVTLPAMRRAIWTVTLLSCAVGLPLVVWGGWPMALVGAACIVFCFLYTTVLSRMAMGDVLVLLFFGIVPVCATYYIQTQTLTTGVFCLSLACGLVTDCLLVVNNYRDRVTDVRAGKCTLVTLIGAKASEWLYLLLGLAGVALTMPVLNGWQRLVGILPYLVGHVGAWRMMTHIGEGRDLNRVLGWTALNILGFGLLVSLLILW